MVTKQFNSITEIKMAKFTIILFAFLNTMFVFANNGKLEKAKEKYSKAKSISYRTTAFYPNPDTEEITSFSTYYTIYNFRDSTYDFYSKSENKEEIYENETYTQVNHTEKIYYKYEYKFNQVEDMKSFRLILYGPINLLNHNWSFLNDTIIDEKITSHYSFVESERKFENKAIKVEYHIYISSDCSISKFERKSYVDNKLGQNVTYQFDDYTFSNKKNRFKYSLPENYSLKYFERVEQLVPLMENIKAPAFVATDIIGNEISTESLTQKTLLLFSSTNCGYSIFVSNYINNTNFELKKDIRLINIYGSDSKESTIRISKKHTKNYSIIAERKDIEKIYGVSGYPVLYLVNENGIIMETVGGADNILSYLKKLNENKD